ncbi:hypothetical protein [Streptacidiphilus sp. EB103A]
MGQRRSNVDTDQIIPAHWLKKVTRSGGWQVMVVSPGPLGG